MDTDRDGIVSLESASSTLAPVGHSITIPGHTTFKTLSISNQHDSIAQTDGKGSKDSAYQISKRSVLLSHILRYFDKDLHNNRTEFEKKIART